MATKQELYDKLTELAAENHQLRQENEAFRLVLYGIYGKVRVVLGIEAAAEKLNREKKHGTSNDSGGPAPT